MSAPIMPEARVRADRRYTAVARVAVVLALVLTVLPPKIIRLVLRQVVRGGRPAPAAEVLSMRDAVNSVSRRCAGQGCLQRSIAVLLLARVFGFGVTWKTGFRPSPFVAHAWVEAGGAPIGEPAVVAKFFTVLSVVPQS